MSTTQKMNQNPIYLYFSSAERDLLYSCTFPELGYTFCPNAMCTSKRQEVGWFHVSWRKLSLHPPRSVGFQMMGSLVGGNGQVTKLGRKWRTKQFKINFLAQECNRWKTIN